MAAIAEGVAPRATAAAHQQRCRLLQPHLKGHTAAAEMGPIAAPAMARAAAAAQLMHTGCQRQGIGPRG